ncbi:MAG: arylsulfatase [Verrucomicrobiota bacterium]
MPSILGQHSPFMKPKSLTLLLAAAIFFCCELVASAAKPQLDGTARSPNFVVIMVDDLGYSDLGCYGGEIDTPNLDALAENGLRFSQFYNTAKCHSSRVSLLTGQYCIAAGDTALSHAITSAEVLRDAGYFTAMTGKWHLKKEPTDFGFDRYFGHLSGACNFFTGDNTFRLNGEPWKVPETLNNKTFYTTVAKIDYALDFLNEHRTGQRGNGATGQPFYLYIAFNAPHAPLHALPEDYAKYEGRYTEGWDKIRDARMEKQKDLGLLPADLEPSPRPPHVRAWEYLVPWEQKHEVNRMQTLAAMIDRVDQEIGRLVANLEKHGELENTFILFVSDNGACPYDRRRPQLDVEPTSGEIALGDSTGWAWARNAPFRFYKQNQFEGGISTPGIVHWPAGLKTQAGAIVDTPAHLIDVLPTLADLSGADIPESHPERELRPVSGISLRPVLEGSELAREEPIHLQFSNDYGLRDGNWKLVSFKGQEWELYHMGNDRTERNNLASAEPERLAQMVAKWKDMSENVLLSAKHANPKMAAEQSPKANREWTVFSDSTEGPAANPKKSRQPGSKPIRARKNTKLVERPGVLLLTFTGDDPGIAMDLRSMKDMPAGPYQVSFDLKTDTAGTGDIFYTIDGKTVLPKGENRQFPVNGTDAAQAVRVDLKTDKQLHQLRIDVSDGEGAAEIANLQLLGLGGKVIKDWTKKE